jgi:hypothetical protein
VVEGLRLKRETGLHGLIKVNKDNRIFDIAEIIQDSSLSRLL